MAGGIVGGIDGRTAICRTLSAPASLAARSPARPRSPSLPPSLHTYIEEFGVPSHYMLRSPSYCTYRTWYRQKPKYLFENLTVVCFIAV